MEAAWAENRPMMVNYQDNIYWLAYHSTNWFLFICIDLVSSGDESGRTIRSALYFGDRWVSLEEEMAPV